MLGASDHTIYPRVLVYNAGDGDGQGATAHDVRVRGRLDGRGSADDRDQPSTATPTYCAVPLNIGGSADCGIVPAGPAGDVATIVVPHGYYDVHTTFTFS